MSKLGIRSQEILSKFSNLEKKHKIITYASLLFLTVSTYFLRTENQDIKVDFAILQEKNVNLQQNMIIFNRNYEGFPLPVWQKVKRGNRFIVQYINPAYIQGLGNGQQEIYDIIGKDNFELFTPKMAQMYYENDVAVAVTGKELESIDRFVNEKGDTISLKVVKWRDITQQKDTLIYGMVKEFLK